MLTRADQRIVFAVAKHVLEEIAASYLANPYYWERERDVQAAIAEKLRAELARKELSIVRDAKFKRKALAEIRNVSRVGLEPSLWKKGEEKFIYPDVVVWDDYPEGIDRRRPGAPDWGILLAIEIKYRSSKTSDADVKKMMHQVTRRKQVVKGCIITFGIDSTSEVGYWCWKKQPRAGAKLWQICVMAPK